MRTKLNGRYRIIAIICAILLLIGSVSSLFDYYRNKQAQKAENEIVLSKDKWHCFAGLLNDNSNFECMIYKRKEIDFGAHSGPRQRNNDIPKGKPVQQTQ